VDLWHELLPRMTYHSIELDGGCALKFVPRLGARQFIGSQDDPHFLGRVVNSTGPLDVVIDDGSHYSEHQRATFSLLWPHVKPGGIYVIEDLQCAFLSGYHGEQTGLQTGGSPRMIVEIVLALMGRGRGPTQLSRSGGPSEDPTDAPGGSRVRPRGDGESEGAPGLLEQFARV
jgi:demethylmacrocin O-methyltransferase